MNDTKWFKVFRAGNYPQGNVSIADVKEMASSYNREYHEAPLTTLHDDSSPAYAVVDQVKEVNGVLFVTFADILPTAYDINKQYKKPSIEITLYDDKKYLRAVTLTNFPQVKGMDRIQFAEQHPNVYFSEDYTINLFKGHAMITDLVKKFAENLSINVSNYQCDGDILAEAERIVTEIKSKFGDATGQVQQLTLNLSKYTEAGITIEKFNEMKTLVDTYKTERIESLISFALTTKNILPNQKDHLKTLAETNFDTAKAFVEGLPDKPGAPKIHRFTGGELSTITYEDILKEPTLAKQFTEQQLLDLRKKSKTF